jgi:hypothetical protein
MEWVGENFLGKMDGFEMSTKKLEFNMINSFT